MNFVSHLAGRKLSGKPTLNCLGGSVRMLGNMNRAMPSVHSKCVTASDVKPTASDEPNSTPAACREERRGASSPSRPQPAAAWHSRAWPASAALRASSSPARRGDCLRRPLPPCVIGPGFAPLRAAARCSPCLWRPLAAAAFGGLASASRLSARQPLASQPRGFGSRGGLGFGSGSRGGLRIRLFRAERQPECPQRSVPCTGSGLGRQAARWSSGAGAQLRRPQRAQLAVGRARLQGLAGRFLRTA